MRIPDTTAERLDFFTLYLLNDIMTFWQEHALDETTGALRTCIDDDGTILSDDIYLWSQLRGIWTYSALYNRIEKRKEWLNIAGGLTSFCNKYGRDDEGRWCYRVSPAGEILDGAISLYADGFAIYGLSEYYRATGSEEARRIALETYENVRKRLAKPGSYLTAPYTIPEGAKAHAVSMIFSLCFHELGKALERDDICDAGYELACEVMNSFRQRKSNLVLEYVGLNDKVLKSPEGRIVVPGHAIESMWFQIYIFRDRGEMDMVHNALECIKKHLEFGWDPEYGGILLGGDSKGKDPVWPNWEMKVWWPHTEAIYALVLAREFSKAEWIEEWFNKVMKYSFSTFPVMEHGEWTQRMNRKGEKVTDVIALPVKDPFHLPRALILSIESLRRQIT